MSCWAAFMRKLLKADSSAVAMRKAKYGNEDLYEGEITHSLRPATCEDAEQYLKTCSLRNSDGSPYSVWSNVCSRVPLLDKGGIGLYLYFFSLRFFCLVFLLLTCICAYQLHLDLDGDYYSERDQSNYFPCLGNSPAITPRQNATLQETQEEFDRLDKLKVHQVGSDACCTFVFQVAIIVYALLTKRIVKKHRAQRPTVADFSIKLSRVRERDICDTVGFFESNGIKVHEVVPVRHTNQLFQYFSKYQSERHLATLRQLETVHEQYQLQRKRLEHAIARLEVGIWQHEALRQSHSLVIVFETRQDRANALELVSRNWLTANAKHYFAKCCLEADQQWKNRMCGKRIAVPTEIYWENIRKKQCIMRTVYYSLTAVVILGSASIIFALRSQQNSLDRSSTSYENNEEPDSNSRTQSGAVKLVISLCITLINIMIPVILSGVLTTKEKHSTLPKIKLSAMLKNFVFMLINTSFIILIVNADFRDFKVHYVLRMIDSRFKDYSRDWYLEVGYSITMSMFFCIFSPHLGWCLYYWIKRMLARKVQHYFDTQLAFNNWIIGGDIDLVYKTAMQLVVIYGCFMYSGGMPLMLPICALALMSIFIADSYLLRYLRKPQEHSTILHTWFLKLLPGTVFIHSLFSAYMYGADSVFPHLSPTTWNERYPGVFDQQAYLDHVKNSYEQRATDYCGVTFIVLGFTALLTIGINSRIRMSIGKHYAQETTVAELKENGLLQHGESYYAYRNERYKDFYAWLFEARAREPEDGLIPQRQRSFTHCESPEASMTMEWTLGRRDDPNFSNA